MRIWECDMCKKVLHDESETHTVQIENPRTIDPKQIKELGVCQYSTFGTYDLCHDCAKRVEKFIKDGLTEVVIPVKPTKESLEKLQKALMPWKEVQMLKDKKVSRPSLNQISDAKPGACFHGEVWMTCPHCGEGHEMTGAKPEWTEDKFRVYKCSKCGELFKDRITY